MPIPGGKKDPVTNTPVPCRVCGPLDVGDPRNGNLCPDCFHDMLGLAAMHGWPVDDPVCRRFVIKLDMGGPIPAHAPELGPCWSWLAATNAGGYGAFKVAGKTLYAHDLAYQWTNGEPVPPGLVHDHLCHDWQTCREGDGCPHRACASPLHLQAATHHENTMVRSNSITAEQARRDDCGTCRRPLAGTNLYQPPGGGERQCRFCRRVAHQRGEQTRQAYHAPVRRPGAGQIPLIAERI